ncbi:hypothetical protein Vadar_019822 [Vaccinium darrowii]|uniref:Uncharacterized protein n=1 Tax=Vaccinium darrowii TaxID=229202 RepID=A0ACB7YXU9_9ERIC|nr:hypothetical protein Vadar_019822 [Vaccinium darrowii]
MQNPLRRLKIVKVSAISLVLYRFPRTMTISMKILLKSFRIKWNKTTTLGQQFGTKLSPMQCRGLHFTGEAAVEGDEFEDIEDDESMMKMTKKVTRMKTKKMRRRRTMKKKKKKRRAAKVGRRRVEEHKLEKVSRESVHRNASNSKSIKLQTTFYGTVGVMVANCLGWINRRKIDAQDASISK